MLIVSPLYLTPFSLFFFFNDAATTEIYTLSLHDALPIFADWSAGKDLPDWYMTLCEDRKSTRLNSSHVEISYAVFCLKKKKKINYYSIQKKKNNINKKYKKTVK